MKAKLVLTVMAVAALLATGACSLARGASVPQQANVEVTTEEFLNMKHVAREVTIAHGGVLTVTLGSNPTTGFRWTEIAQIGDPTILQQADNEFLIPDEQGVVGAAGKQVWTFKALKTGTTTVSMEYSRPWQGGEKGEWTFDLTVVVK